MKIMKKIFSVVIILTIGLVAGIAVRDMFSTEAQAQNTALEKQNFGGYAVTPILSEASTQGVVAISPEGDVYIIHVNPGVFSISGNMKPKIVEHFTLKNSKTDKKW